MKNDDYNEEHVQLYSYWPILLATGIILIPIGIVSVWPVSVVGSVIVLSSIMGWAWEVRTQPQEEEGDE
jgi:hypothetical protein